MKNNYVLITAAKNEADFIESTIKSVVRQTLQPKKWIIVSDHSTDGTDYIVNKYSNEYSFISLLKFDGALNRNFASKVHAISAAFDLLKRYSIIKLAIQQSNLTSTFVYEDNAYSIAEAILLKQYLYDQYVEILQAHNANMADQQIMNLKRNVGVALTPEQMEALDLIPELYYDPIEIQKQYEHHIGLRTYINALIDKSNHNTIITL